MRRTIIFMLLLSGCGPDVDAPVPDEPGTQTTPTGKADIFGEDDRMEAFELDADSPVRRARRATAAMINNSEIQVDGEAASYTGSASTLGDGWHDLCGEHPYSNQPAVAGCTGFLVAPDVLITAGHCMKAQDDPSARCSDRSWVFGFEYADAEEAEQGGVPTFEASDVYQCAEVLSAQYFGCTADYAVLRLDRPVEGREPIELASENRPEMESEVFGLGFPNGVPMKVSPGGVTNLSFYTSRDSFETTIDGFGGNSGSPVVDAEGRVHGIHVCGNPRGEYEAAEGESCSMPFVCDEEGECRGMGTYLTSNLATYVDCLAGTEEPAECGEAVPSYPACDPAALTCEGGLTCQWSSSHKAFHCMPGTEHTVAHGDNCFADVCETGAVCRYEYDSAAGEKLRRCRSLCSDPEACGEQAACEANRSYGDWGLCELPASEPEPNNGGSTNNSTNNAGSTNNNSGTNNGTTGTNNGF